MTPTLPLPVNGVVLSYRDSGDPLAPPVVLVHGSSSNAATWDRFAARVTAAGYRAIAVDLRGHGRSDRSEDYRLSSVGEDLVGLLEALDLWDATVVGHSVGGYAALEAAVAAPHRVARLVLEDLAAPPLTAAPVTPGALLRLLGSGRGLLTLRRDYDLRAVTAFVRRLARPDVAWWARLGSIRQPALLFSGGPGSCIPPQRLAEVADAMPDARLITLPVGHRVHSLAPQEFADAVLRFLRETQALLSNSSPLNEELSTF